MRYSGKRSMKNMGKKPHFVSSTLQKITCLAGIRGRRYPQYPMIVVKGDLMRHSFGRGHKNQSPV